MERMIIVLAAIAAAGFVFIVARQFSNGGRALHAAPGRVVTAGTLARLCRSVGGFVGRLLPGRLVTRWSGFLSGVAAFAGVDELIWTAEAMIGSHMLGLLGGMAVFQLVFKGWPLVMRWLVGAVLGLWYVHNRWLNQVKERQTSISKGFPFALDLIQLCVRGGLSINMSIQRLANTLAPGYIRDEFMRVIAAVQHGSPLTEALRRMSARVQPTEIRAVLLALTQAIEHGGQIGDTLQVQAQQLRFNRLMAVEEEIQKLPTRMTLPIILFFMPCMLIMTIGPLAISVWFGFRGQ